MLLDAVEAALALAADWEAAARSLDEAAAATSVTAISDQMSARAKAHRDHAKAFGETIARELLGKEDDQ